MAGNIKGITIEINGSTTGLDKALKDVNSQSVSLQNELKQVDRLLKFNPGNTELIAQKQGLLAQQVQVTTEKLNRLKDAQKQVEDQFSKGEIGADQYRAFQREVIQTEGKLNGLKQKLAQVGDTSIQPVKQDLSQVSKEAENAEGAVKNLGGELTSLVAGAVAGGGIAGVIEKALDTSSLNTKIDVSMEVPPESIQSVKDAINTVSSYGVDAEAALEGVRRQWALNKDASDETNAAVVKGAATVANAYSGIDFNELIQEVNEMSKALGISNEDALALTNSLLKAGFPPEQLDVIAEYGTQLKMAGYSAEEIQAIFAAGIDTGTWNIDNLLDGIKEGRIRLAEFGTGIDNTTASLLQGTNISTQQLQQWGQAVAKGGEGGKQAMQEVAKALVGVTDETTRNALGVQIFGTMWEDQGSNITDTILGMNNNLTTAKQNQDALNDSINKLNDDPAVKMQQAMTNLQTSLAPLLVAIANIIGKIAEWVSNNPVLAATITAIVTALGIFIGVAMALAPIVTALSTGATAFGIGLLPLAGIIAGVIVAITALIAAGVYLYKNWDEVKAYAISIWEAIKDFLSQTWEGIKQVAGTIWGAIKDFFTKYWDELLMVFTGPLGILVGLIIKNWDSIKQTTLNVWNSIKEFFSILWEGVKSVFNTVITAIVDFVKQRWENLKTNTSTVFTAIKTVISDIWNGIKTFFSTIISNIISTVTTKFGEMKNSVSSKMNEVKSTISDIWNNVMSFFSGINLYDIGVNIIQGLIDGITSMVDTLMEKARSIANSIKKTIQSALDIHSPSRVMFKLGEYTGEGFALGIQSTIGEISRQSQAMAKVVNPSTSTGTATGSSQSIGRNLSSEINQTVNIYSPTALSPSETARQNRRVLQELALQL